MKKIIATLLLVAFVFICVACGSLSGTYRSESKKYSIEFKRNGTCTWYQDGMFFNGTYEKEDDYYRINIEGQGFYGNTTFTAVELDDQLMINGGVVKNEVFEKQ